MGAQGTAVLDFGVFPGSNVAIVDVAAVGVISTSAIEAWIRAEATADHTDMDHVAAAMKVVGAFLSDDNIRIYGINTNDVITPVELRPSQDNQQALRGTVNWDRQNAPMLVGQFNVHWCWN